MVFSKELLDILVCPKCKGGLIFAEKDSSLVCAACALKYPVRDGIPVMLPDEAEAVGNQEL
jgi:uncharacterized protein